MQKEQKIYSILLAGQNKSKDDQGKETRGTKFSHFGGKKKYDYYGIIRIEKQTSKDN